MYEKINIEKNVQINSNFSRRLTFIYQGWLSSTILGVISIRSAGNSVVCAYINLLSLYIIISRFSILKVS